MISGCTKQPSEQQKIAVEKEILGCTVLRTASLDEDNSSFGDAISALINLKDISSFKNKRWEQYEDGSINVKFDQENDKYDCNFTLNSEGKYHIENVSRNNVEIYNRLEDERIKQKKAEIAENKRIEAVKKWSEKSFSNASYKYYEKRKVDSRLESGEETLEVICQPDDVRVTYDDNQFRMSGRKQVEFKFIKKDEEIVKKYDLTSNGTIGKEEQTTMGTDVKFNSELNHQFLDEMEQSIALEVDGIKFNIDEYQSVPCLKTRKDDLFVKKRLLETYLSELKKSTIGNKDNLTGEVTYIVKGKTDRISSDVFGTSGSQVVGIVTHYENKPLSSDAFSVVFGTIQRIKSKDTLDELNITFMNDGDKVEITLPCRYDFNEALRNQYGYANEYCEFSGDLNQIKLLGLANAIRVSARGIKFESGSAEKEQKIFLEDLIRIASVVSKP
jgi:hypothetical protein